MPPSSDTRRPSPRSRSTWLFRICTCQTWISSVFAKSGKHSPYWYWLDIGAVFHGIRTSLAGPSSKRLPSYNAPHLKTVWASFQFSSKWKNKKMSTKSILMPHIENVSNTNYSFQGYSTLFIKWTTITRKGIRILLFEYCLIICTFIWKVLYVPQCT